PPAVVDARQRRERALDAVDDAHELQRGAPLAGEEAAEDPEGGGELEKKLEEGVEAEEARLGGPGGEEVEVLVGCRVELAEGVEAEGGGLGGGGGEEGGGRGGGGVELGEGGEGVEGGVLGDPEGVGEEVDEVDGWERRKFGAAVKRGGVKLTEH